MSIKLTISQGHFHADALTQEASFSDLFFNYDHPAFEAFLTNDSEGNDGDGKEELLKDANEFVATMRNATGFQLDAAELVEDYFSRM